MYVIKTFVLDKIYLRKIYIWELPSYYSHSIDCYPAAALFSSAKRVYVKFAFVIRN